MDMLGHRYLHLFIDDQNNKRIQYTLLVIRNARDPAVSVGFSVFGNSAENNPDSYTQTTALQALRANDSHKLSLIAPHCAYQMRPAPFSFGGKWTSHL